MGVIMDDDGPLRIRFVSYIFQLQNGKIENYFCSFSVFARHFTSMG